MKTRNEIPVTGIVDYQCKTCRCWTRYTGTLYLMELLPEGRAAFEAVRYCPRCNMPVIPRVTP